MEQDVFKNKLKMIIANDHLGKEYKNFIIFGNDDKNEMYAFAEVIDENEYFIMHHIKNYDKYIEVLCQKLNVNIEGLYNILKESNKHAAN